MKDYSQQPQKNLKSFITENPELFIAIIAASALLAVILILIFFVEFDYSFSLSLFSTLLGFFLNILLFGVLIVLIRRRQERKLDIKRWLEEIDDYRSWKEAEAAYRIVGNIKRLNNYGISSINLSSCNLKEAYLESLNLQGADLMYADLKGAYLGKADLQGANLEEAKLQGAFLIKTNLQGANLKLIDLQGAMLREANLQGANFKSANLQEADFMFASLRNIDGFTIDQFSKAKTLYQAKLDSGLEKEIKEKYPHILEKPKEETGGSPETLR